jgi:cell division protein FtsB
VRASVRRSLGILLPLLALLVAWGWWRAVVAERATRREVVELRARRQQLEETNRELAREVEALKNDREARARAAREALDVAAPGEILVVVPRATPTRGAQ